MVRSTLYRFGALTWTDGVHTARSPIVVRPVAIVAPAEVTGTGSSGATSFSIKMGYVGSLSYAKRGLIPSTVFSGTVADDPTDNFDIANPTGNQGITTHDINVPAGTSRAARVDVRRGDRRSRRYRSLSLQSQRRQLAYARRIERQRHLGRAGSACEPGGRDISAVRSRVANRWTRCELQRARMGIGDCR